MDIIWYSVNWYLYQYNNMIKIIIRQNFPPLLTPRQYRVCLFSLGVVENWWHCRIYIFKNYISLILSTSTRTQVSHEWMYIPLNLCGQLSCIFTNLDIMLDPRYLYICTQSYIRHLPVCVISFWVSIIYYHW